MAKINHHPLTISHPKQTNIKLDTIRLEGILSEGHQFEINISTLSGYISPMLIVAIPVIINIQIQQDNTKTSNLYYFNNDGKCLSHTTLKWKKDRLIESTYDTNINGIKEYKEIFQEAHVSHPQSI